ncbi:hypothetical protein L1S32_04970 [Methanogenium sp. S4BF]|uniref:hypothetical protein n=1 Tax=Methanogenium sp. S4BF TaxID=1789226 RepID=UPI00241794A0|nr:hypothetical protein [Methanogenium sp. S4BF]WFN35463.1 hypothetical protein L1S32_04970 [Methanogenium sp. S4BF]
MSIADGVTFQQMDIFSDVWDVEVRDILVLIVIVPTAATRSFGISFISGIS